MNEPSTPANIPKHEEREYDEQEFDTPFSIKARDFLYSKGLHDAVESALEVAVPLGLLIVMLAIAVHTTMLMIQDNKEDHVFSYQPEYTE